MRRDRYRLGVLAVTGVATAGCLTATGWLVGQAAQTWSAQQPAPSVTESGSGAHVGKVGGTGQRHRAEGDDERVVLRPRPTRTRVTTRYVAPAVPVGGGSVSTTPTHQVAKPPAPSSGS